MQTHDCQPTLTDTQVLEFCKNGHHMIEAAVPPEINERVVAAMDEQWDRGGRQMHSFTEQDWFVESVLCNPAAAGAARSLLGANFALPNWATWFREESPVPANQWHIDGGSMFDGQMNTLKWFYYPTACPEEMGPTEFVPGSHHVTNQVRFMAHYDSIRGTWKSTAPAGSIYFTAYPMWHRRANATATGLRYMLTGTYHRTVPPTRDWIREPDFDFATADYWLEEPRFGEQYRSTRDAASLFMWLCGLGDKFAVREGPVWPMPAAISGRPFGVPAGV